MKSLIVLGSGPMAFTVRDMLEGMDSPPYRLAGFSQNLDPSRRGETFEDVRVFSTEELRELASSHVALCVLGKREARSRFVEEAETLGFEFATLIDPSCRVSPHASIGKGCYLRMDVLVMNHCRVGDHCSIMSRVTMTENVTVGNGSFISSAATIAGSVVLGKGVFVGTGAIIIDHIQVGDGATIGAGAVVIRDVPPGTTVVGNPARELPKRRDEGS